MAWYENGYVMVSTPGGNHRNKRGCMKLAIIVAELVLGKPLPPGVVVHHINGIKDDDRPENLVICENQAYHYLLHERIKAREATGDTHKRRCKLCKQWDDPNDSGLKKSGESWVHSQCEKDYHRKYYLDHREHLINKSAEYRIRRQNNG